MTSIRLSITNHRLDPDKRQLLIDWNDGRQDIFPYLWLRHSHNFPFMGRAGQLDPREYQLPENPANHAIGQFYRLLLSSARVFEVLLNPGEMVVFDNHRVLHGRRAFDPQTSQRWLQQLSIDREEFQNQFRQLAEAQGRDDISRWDQDAGTLSQG